MMSPPSSRFVPLLLGLLLGAVLALGSLGDAQSSSMAPITSALSGVEGEIRTGVQPAVVGVLAIILVIGIGAGVVRVISRNV
jgi:H+/Cl- antiporter ClcA